MKDLGEPRSFFRIELVCNEDALYPKKKEILKWLLEDNKMEEPRLMITAMRVNNQQAQQDQHISDENDATNILRSSRASWLLG